MSSFRIEGSRVSFTGAVGTEIPRGKTRTGAVVSTKLESPAEAVMQDNFSKRHAAEVKSEAERLREEAEKAEKQAVIAQETAAQLLEEAKREADETLKKARELAKAMAKRAEEEAAELMEAEKKRGYEEGREQAKEESETALLRQKEEYDALSSGLQSDYDEQIRSLRSGAITLVVDIAEKVVGAKIAESDEAFIRVVDGAIDKIKVQDGIAVHLSGADYKRFFGSAAVRGVEEASGKKLTLTRDPSLRDGDCVLETDNEIIDCGAPGQVRRLGEMLRSHAGIPAMDTPAQVVKPNGEDEGDDAADDGES